MTLLKVDNACIPGFPPLANCTRSVVGLSENKEFVHNLTTVLNAGDACVVTPLCFIIEHTPLCVAVPPLCVICSLRGMAETLWTGAMSLWTGAKSLLKGAKCIADVKNNCDTKRRHRRAAASEVIEEVIDSNVAIVNYLTTMKEVFGGDDMFDVYDNSWMNSFKLAFAEDSVDGQFLSQSEITSIIAPLNVSLAPIVKKFLFRWNKTLTAWEDGTLTTLGAADDVICYDVIMTGSEQFREDTENVKKRGFDSIFDEFYNSVNVYQKLKKKDVSGEEICAKVRVRIVQELVLTRDAFSARLEIENGEASPLEDITVTVNITATYGDGSYTNNKFSIGKPTLVGITAVDGSGRLERDVSGTVEYLIIPYSTAAVEDNTLYDVGGTLSYAVDGSVFSVTLLPDTITVKPNPNLILNYFYEKYVQGDDPLTENITEPVVPFTVAAMVSNSAYGVARQLRITSAQLKIIENEKGLLASFKIMGAQLGKERVTPSLSIDFGDIKSFETKTAYWHLTSFLKGQSHNFTATFENVNPLGDPQLSIMEHVGFHELIHLVRLESSNDNLDDFLVNDIIDENEMADTVYDSSKGSISTDVVPATVTEFSLEKIETTGTKTYSYINLTVTVSCNKTSTYFYTRLENNLTRDSITESLIEVIRNDDKQILVPSNAWQTNYFHDAFYLHIFDYISNLNVSKSLSYSLVFGRRNIFTPTFSRDIYNFELSIGQAPGHIYFIKAMDKDPSSNLRYMLHNASLFTISETTGELRNTAMLEVGNYTLTVMVTDDGKPPHQSSVEIIITVTGSTPTDVSGSSTKMQISIILLGLVGLAVMTKA